MTSAFLRSLSEEVMNFVASYILISLSPSPSPSPFQIGDIKSSLFASIDTIPLEFGYSSLPRGLFHQSMRASPPLIWNTSLF